ncbi:MAG: hypothetical protein ACL7BU_00215 [Candidatus Phlomobacter fragariae]
MNNLAQIYEKGYGVKKNRLMQLNCIDAQNKYRGGAIVQYNMEFIYDTGEYLEKNNYQDFYWYKRAAE